MKLERCSQRESGKYSNFFRAIGKIIAISQREKNVCGIYETTKWNLFRPAR